jgi:hypothetical protein
MGWIAGILPLYCGIMKKTLFIFCFVIGGLLPVTFAQGIPPAPAKVVRYARVLMERYDTSGDGVLQREEWVRMPGTPPAIDLNGDGQITHDELVRHFNVYGQDRTIHRTIVRVQQERYVFDPANMQMFSPVMPRTVAPPPAAPVSQDPSEDDGVEGIMKTHDESIDEDVFEKLLLERQIPSSRPYHVMPEHLRGVPAWFYVLDKNGDGQITLAEFAGPRYFPARVVLFKSLDRNGNGFIEPDEVRITQTPVAAPGN